jgi:predicted PurR-regulated permease PerM
MTTRRHEAQRLSQIAFYGTVLLIGWLAWQIVQPFLAELGWAVVLAICLAPVRQRMEPRLGRTRTALVLTALVFLLIVLPTVFIAMTLISEGGAAVTYVDAQLKSQGGPAGWFHWAWSWLRARAPFLPTEQEVIARITASIGSVAQFLAGQAGNLLASAASFVFSLFITLGALFFTLRDAPEFSSTVRRVLPFGAAQNARMMAIASELVTASVTATLAIAGVQGLIGGVAFAVLGIQGAVLWGVIMALLAFLPMVGAALVWAPAAIWLALSGSLVKGIVLAAIGLVIMGQVDNVIRPLLLSGKAQMNTLVLIISLLGGVSAFGFIGIVLGPLVAALLTAIVEGSHEVLEAERPAADLARAKVPLEQPVAAGTPVEPAGPGAPAPPASQG